MNINKVKIKFSSKKYKSSIDNLNFFQYDDFLYKAIGAISSRLSYIDFSVSKISSSIIYVDFININYYCVRYYH